MEVVTQAEHDAMILYSRDPVQRSKVVDEIASYDRTRPSKS
jgi:hypothetical protein